MWDIIGKIAVALFVTRIGWSFIKGLYGSFIGAMIGMNANFKKLGKWAVVTGATDGIGKAFAHEMARHGLNVVLISRTPFKLQNVAAEIHKKYGVETKIIDVDFTLTTIYDRISKELSGLEIGVLVNNVGMSYEYPEYFIDVPDQVIQNLINCNIVSVTQMSRIVIPAMQERKKGLVINISSLSSLIPAPFLTVYGATKAYMSNFSRSLAVEMKPDGISVQCITPAFVVSNMSKLRSATLMAPTPEAFVRSSLKTSGIERSTGGYYMHKLQIYLMELGHWYFPGSLLDNLTYNELKQLRTRALTKKLKEDKSL